MSDHPTLSVFEKPALISDDDDFFRIALSSVLKRKLGFPEVISTSSFDEAVEHLAEGREVGLALFDLNMPGMDNWVNLRTVRTSYPEVRVSVVSASQNRQDILMALSTGLHGYIYKGLGAGEMERALRLICEGIIYVPPILTEWAASPERDGMSSVLTARSEQIVMNLTPRQKEILNLLVAGKSNKAMARSLGLSEGTVKFHLAAVFRVLGSSNRVEAATAGTELLRTLDVNGVHY